mmetsp:Transcript_20227/g.62540  ORF Transcript_20227/g.62540 Transcript_20227/m.62540 type:complete len:371 (-) Transcript_20227:1113-2225(-)
MSFTFAASVEQTGPGLAVTLQGPWADVTGTVCAQAKYTLDSAPAGYDLGSAETPPSGTYSGRMNVGGANAPKKNQIVDKMTLRFRSDENGATGDGEGSNRVGRYTTEVTKCERKGRGFALELSRTYTGPPILARQDSVDSTTKKRAELPAVVESGPRKPRAAAPPKGAWGAATSTKKLAEDDDGPPAKKKVKKEEDDSAEGPPCLAVVFPGGDETQRVAAARRCPTLTAASTFLAGHSLERDAAIRVPSDQGDGVLFPPADLSVIPSKYHRAPLPFSAAHVVLLDVDPAAAKRRAWKPTVAAFTTASRAAHYCLHVARTCGPRLHDLCWLAFKDTAASDATLRMHLRHDGSFDAGLPVADMPALEKSAVA